MKLTLILFAFFLNSFYPATIKAEEKIDSSSNQIEKSLKGEKSEKSESESNRIHIVQVGDTITSISKFYSIKKELIIKMNNLKDENYIYIGQNLKISDKKQVPEKINEYQGKYHLVQKGENLTQIASKYGLELKYLKTINNVKDQDSIEVGSKLFLTNNKAATYSKTKEDFQFKSEDNKNYGPITIQQNELEEVSGRKILNVLNQSNKKLIISIDCETKNLDVRIPYRKWRGWEPAEEEFEKRLLNDFC